MLNVKRKEVFTNSSRNSLLLPIWTNRFEKYNIKASIQVEQLS